MPKLFFVLVSAFFGWGNVCAESIPKTLLVGWDDYPPMQMMGQGKLRGIDVDIATEVLKGAGFLPKFVKLPWSRQLKQIENGTLDIALSASISEDRKRYAVWTEAYRLESVSLLKLVSTPGTPASLTSLLGGKALIGLIRGSEYGDEFETLQSDPRFQELFTATTSNQNSMDMLRAKRFPYVMENHVTFFYLAQSQSGERVIEALRISNKKVHLMLGMQTLKKYPEVVKALNASLKRLKDAKGIERIYAKYGLKP